MRLWLGITVALLLSGVANAATYTVTLDDADIAYLGKLLGKEPYNDVNALITKLQAQINAQVNERANKDSSHEKPVAPDPKK